jgi:hypothetical protein
MVVRRGEGEVEEEGMGADAPPGAGSRVETRGAHAPWQRSSSPTPAMIPIGCMEASEPLRAVPSSNLCIRRDLSQPTSWRIAKP